MQHKIVETAAATCELSHFFSNLDTFVDRYSKIVYDECANAQKSCRE